MLAAAHADRRRRPHAMRDDGAFPRLCAGSSPSTSPASASAFDLPLALAGTPFQREVWQALREIPYGETISYGELARRIGRPRARSRRGPGERPQPDRRSSSRATA